MNRRNAGVVRRMYCPTPLNPIMILEEINCKLSTLVNVGSNLESEIKLIRESITSTLPLVAKVEYPEIVDGKLIYHWIGYTFRDYVLGPLNIYFSGSITNDPLPVFIVDESGFAHTVTEIGNPLVQQLGIPPTLLDVLIPATYSGNYIHLT